jgi:hypothetical protein
MVSLAQPDAVENTDRLEPRVDIRRFRSIRTYSPIGAALHQLLDASEYKYIPFYAGAVIAITVSVGERVACSAAYWPIISAASGR